MRKDSIFARDESGRSARRSNERGRTMTSTSSPAFDRYFRVANYLSAAQIYLTDNVLLREKLRPAHIKRRLLGHWGTCPGINLVYAGLNRALLDRDQEVLLITGPGHGAPANLANLYLEGTLEEYYPALTHDECGVTSFVRRFSWPGGFPSHLYPGVPGTIHEGGELGYALSTAFGAAFDNPHLVVACIVGDGEAETGPTATAWHGNKFLDPKRSGAVLPILHLNGYKISSPTIFGSMADNELRDLFSGYGWNPRIVQGEDLVSATAEAMSWALDEIRGVQQYFRSHQIHADPRPRWPLVVLRSLKGWTGVKEVDGKPVEGSYRSHQVPISDPIGDSAHLHLLESWLRSYRPEELFTTEGSPAADILACCPRGKKRMGASIHALGGKARTPLELPRPHDYAVAASEGERGRTERSPMEVIARYLAECVRKNPSTFRLFCPDELESNRLTEIFSAPTQRAFQWPVEGSNRAEHIGSGDGRVMEILSEHTCQGWLQGYVLTGRHGLFPSYESFLPIVTSMMDQFAKFLKMSREFSWRQSVPALNYLETSTLWRQEHNGFSHQSPGFINSLLNKKGEIMRVYLPPDANCLLSTLDHCLRGIDHVNLMIANKHPSPNWLSWEEAVAHCRAGASIWHWASTDEGIEPDVVLVGIGDITTVEVLAAADLLNRDEPSLRVRVVNVTDLLILEHESLHPHGLDDDLFEALFTADRSVIVNFHGYPSAVKQLLFGRRGCDRFTINGYREEGTTTTPFDMLVRNGVSRFDLARQALRAGAKSNPRVAARVTEHISRYDTVLKEFVRTIAREGEDPEEIRRWKWSGLS